MNKEFVREKHLEKAFDEMHKIKPEVLVKRENNSKYSVKLSHGGREVVLTEQMKDGLTNMTYLEFKGEVKAFKRYYDAEQVATTILKGLVWEL